MAARKTMNLLNICITFFTCTFLPGLIIAPYVAADLLFSKKCMGDLGCFENSAPFFDILQRPLSLLPVDRDVINTTFIIYTSNNPFTPWTLSINSSTDEIAEVGLEASLKTYFLVSGFMSHFDKNGWDGIMKDALVRERPCNVIIANWKNGDGMPYEQALANARVVGAEIARMINLLQKVFNIQPESVHIIGHSLGAHIAGYAGKRLNKLGRITGMDPAGPYFEDVKPEVRLDASDALFVDNIHTNTASSRLTGFGTTESIGHFDFFPNGGSTQPSCPGVVTAIWEVLKHPSWDKFNMSELFCHHRRAVDLMMSSARHKDCPMMAVACDTWENASAGHCGTCDGHVQGVKKGLCVEMGINADKYAHIFQQYGPLKLFLNTTGTEPYCVKSPELQTISV